MRVFPHANWRSRFAASSCNFIWPNHFIDRYREGGKKQGQKEGGREEGEEGGRMGERWMDGLTDGQIPCFLENKT